jgi:chemotaxis protein MotB
VEEEKIIIKRIKQKGNTHGGHGGSSWKVAYADFVTALMAFFLLLWLITMISPEKQAAVSHYFRHFNVFDSGGGTRMSLFTNKAPDQAIIVPPLIDEEQEKKKKKKTEPEDKLSEKLKNVVEKKLYDVKEQILIGTFSGGIKVELIDKDGSSMFPLGSSELTPKAKEIIKVITENIKSENNKVALEGHTDALSYSTNRYTNWELSTERASAARKEFQNNGLSPDRIIKVAGLAATEPLIKENPYDPRNRRISILLINPNPNPNLNPNLSGEKPREEEAAAPLNPNIQQPPFNVLNPPTPAHDKEKDPAHQE